MTTKKKVVAKKKAAKKKAVTKKKVAAKPRKAKTTRTASKGGSTHGGARPGAGRKAGTATQRTRDVANKLAGEGETPLEYMIRVMRQSDDDLIELEKQGVIDTAERIKIQAERNRRRDQAAEKAAPYIHPRLASVEMDTNAAQHEQWLDDLD